MSVRPIAASDKRPPITTGAQPALLITSTVSAPPDDTRAASAPTLQTRKPGWHARSFNFDWDKPADRHRYQLKTGLPLVHAAILNGEWEHAMELLSPEDLGMVWLTPASQRPPTGPQTLPHASRWASQLPSTNAEKRRRAIIEMVIDVTGLTTVDHTCLHGANLLTLCLLLKVPAKVMYKVLAMACQHAPQYIHLPDANGRTPIDIAAHESSTRIYMQMLGCWSSLSNPDTPYPVAEDPAYVRAWLARHSAADAAHLATHFPALRGALWCFKDKSGLSRLCRMIMEGTLIQHLPPGLNEQVSWYRKQRLALMSLQGENNSPLLVAARHGPASIFMSLLAYDMPAVRPQDNDVPPAWKAAKATRARPGVSLSVSESGSESASDVEVNSTSSSESDEETDLNSLEESDAALPETAMHNEALQCFVLYRPASELEKLLQTLPAIRPSMTEAIKLLGMSATVAAVAERKVTNSYRALMTQISRLLSPAQKMALISQSASGAPEHLSFLLSLPDFPHGQSDLFEALSFASHLHDRVAFDIAAERSTIYRKKPQPIDTRFPLRESTFDHEYLALQAGSKLWLDRFIAAGLDLGAMLDTLGPDVVPMLADTDPEGLPSLLKGLGVKVDEEMIAAARTDQGRQALLALREASGSRPAKA